MSESESTRIIDEHRQQLLDDLTGQAQWREAKALEYPDDRRNGNSAQALRALAAHLERIPPEDDRWRRFAAVWDHLDNEGLARATQDWLEQLRTYGFQHPPVEITGEEAGQFLSLHVEWLEELAAPDEEDPAWG